MDFLRANSYITRSGASLLGISEAAEKIGLKTLAVKLNHRQLVEEAPLPCILHWNQEHFVVLHDVNKSFWHFLPGNQQEKLIIGDPAHNLVAIDKETLQKCWVSTPDRKGVALLLEPTTEFYKDDDCPGERFDYQ